MVVPFYWEASRFTLVFLSIVPKVAPQAHQQQPTPTTNAASETSLLPLPPPNHVNQPKMIGISDARSVQSTETVGVGDRCFRACAPLPRPRRLKATTEGKGVSMLSRLCIPKPIPAVQLAPHRIDSAFAALHSALHCVAALRCVARSKSSSTSPFAFFAGSLGQVHMTPVVHRRPLTHRHDNSALVGL